MVSGWQPDKWNPPIQLDRWIGGIGTHSKRELGGSRVVCKKGVPAFGANINKTRSTRSDRAHDCAMHTVPGVYPPAPVRVVR